MSECGICSSPDRELIERAMREGAGRRTIGRRFGVSPDAAGRHQKHHLARPAPPVDTAAPAVEPEPPPATAAPAEPEPEIAAVAEYFSGMIGERFTVLEPGRIVEGFAIPKLLAERAKLRPPTPAELQRHRATIRGRDYLFTPGPLPDAPPAKPPLPVPSPAEAARIVTANPLAVSDALRLELAERAAVGRLGAPHSLTKAGFARFSRALAEAGDDRGARLRVAITAINFWRELSGQNLAALRHAEEQQRLAAMPPARGFDAPSYLRQLAASRGVTISTPDGTSLQAHPVGSLNPTDRTIISAHHAAILAACQASERIS